MSITNDLSKILEIKEDIYNAISDKEVSIPENTPFEDYASKIASIQIGGDCSILKINPTPSDATVEFTNSNGESIPTFYNQAACSTGKSIKYIVSKNGYRTQQNEQVLNQNTELNVILNEQPYKIYDSLFGVFCLTNDGNLYGSGMANTSWNPTNRQKQYYPNFVLIDTNVQDCQIGQSYFGYLKNGDLYMHGSINGQKTWVYEYTKIAENVKKLGKITHYDICSYIDNNDDLYMCGINSFGEQGVAPDSTYSVMTPTKRASNVKSYFCDIGASYYIDNNDDLYMCGYGRKQGSGTNTNITTFTKRASNVKTVVPSSTTHGSAYITNNNELYLTSNISEYSDYNWHKIADNVLSAKIASNSSNNSILHYIDINNDLYGYSLGDMITPNPMGNGSTSGRAYRVKLASNVIMSFVNGNSAGYINNNNEIYISGLTLLTDDTNTFLKVASDNIDTLYEPNLAALRLIYYGMDGCYYAAGINSYGSSGVDNGGSVVTEFTRIYPTGS